MSELRFLYTWVVSIYRLIVTLVGIPGNLLIIAVYWNKNILGSAQVFIQALALCDLYSCLILPLEQYYWWFELDFHNDLLCKIFFTWEGIGWYISACVTTAIAWDRYLAVCKPFNGRWSRRIAIKVSCLCVFIALSVNVLVPFTSGTLPATVTVAQPNTRMLNVTICYQFGSKVGNVLFILATVPQYLCFLSCFVVVICLYLKLWRTVKAQRNNIGVGANVLTVSQVRHTWSGMHAGRSASSIDCRRTRDQQLDVGPDRWEGVILKVMPNESTIQHSIDTEMNDHTQSRGNKLFTKVRKSDDVIRHSDVTNKTYSGEVTRTRSSQHGVKSKRTLSRVSQMLLSVTVIFVITWMITLVTYIMTPFTSGLSRDSVGYTIIALLRLTGLLNHALNPLLYGFLNPKFRTECSQLYERLKQRLSLKQQSL